MIAFESLIPPLTLLPFLKLPPIGLEDAITDVRAEREHNTPLLAIDMVCYSIASNKAW